MKGVSQLAVRIAAALLVLSAQTILQGQTVKAVGPTPTPTLLKPAYKIEITGMAGGLPLKEGGITQASQATFKFTVKDIGGPAKNIKINTLTTNANSTKTWLIGPMTAGETFAPPMPVTILHDSNVAMDYVVMVNIYPDANSVQNVITKAFVYHCSPPPR